MPEPPRYRVPAMPSSSEPRRLLGRLLPSWSDADPPTTPGQDQARTLGVGITPGETRASSGAGTSDRTQTFRRLWSRVRMAVTRTRLEYVFLVIALAWGVAQVFIVPPLQVPDEGDHWFRAWALTDGQLTADRQGMITLPGVFARTADLYTRLVERGLPISLEGQAGFSGYEDLFNSPGPSGIVRVASRVLSYGPVGYLPQAVGVGLGRLVGAPPLTCFYLARLGNLFAALALLFFAIRLAPFGKQLFVLLALLPMTMFELAAFPVTHSPSQAPCSSRHSSCGRARARRCEELMSLWCCQLLPFSSM